ncbi:hypothetical protein GH714_033289 [Hevea brasiliensis]|uniref:Uncharacterized protein n=1 Tax=Hevea brasiliensis TaxID=3981 RepID=A0A6A6NLK8_HEVBR|nr:hypothetical protein GH714_033289 [Hevea brasiliensis]
MEEFRMKPLDDVKDKEFESDFEELYQTDEEIDDLYNAKEHVMKKMVKDEYFNMDDKKWDEMIKEAMEHGFLKNSRKCEEILQDMLSWDKLLPVRILLVAVDVYLISLFSSDDIKEKVERKYNELGDMCERGEVEAGEAYKLFKHLRMR